MLGEMRYIVQFIRHDYQCVQPASPHVITSNSFTEWTAKGPVYFVGTGLEKCEEIVDNNTEFIFPKRPIIPKCFKHMVKQAQDAFEQQVFEDVTYFDVDYLKAFQTSPQKKNALGQST